MFSTTFECFEGSKKGPAFCFKYAIFLWVTIQTLHKKRIKLSTQKMRMWTCTQKILLFFLSNYGNVASEQLVYLPKNACSYKHTHTCICICKYVCWQIYFRYCVHRSDLRLQLMVYDVCLHLLVFFICGSMKILEQRRTIFPIAKLWTVRRDSLD